MITYSWGFPVFDVAPQEDGIANVVKTVHWRYRATDGEYSAEVYGTAALPSAGHSFIEYGDLTQEIVSGWVVRALGSNAVEDMQKNLSAQIERQKNPTVVLMKPHWD